MPKRIDLTGRIFGELTVIRYGGSHVQPSGQKRALWEVKCSCGVEKTVSTANLTHGNTISCGHVGIEKRKTARRLPDNQAEKNYLYLAYRHSAASRGIVFDIEKNDFLRITQENCEYCGMSPSNFRKSKAKSGSSFSYNGIDRVDNKTGYVAGNVVACCMKCNYMKREQSVDEFIDHARKVVLYAEKRI